MRKARDVELTSFTADDGSALLEYAENS